MGVLLEASNEERKLRACIRGAATLEEALEASINFGGCVEEGSEDEFNFNDFDNCKFFELSDGGGSTEDELDKEVRELNGEPL